MSKALPNAPEPGTLAVLQGVGVAYGRRRVLHDISLTIRPGEFWSVIGPNGAGKSTLLGLFNGLTPFQSGQVFFGGRPLGAGGLRSARLRIAHVFQATDLDPKMPLTVFESVLVGTYGRLGLFKKPGGREKDLALAALETVGLADLAARPIGHLSGGERQRTAIARALAQEPDLLLLDEPTAALDWQAQREILNTVAVLRETYSITVCMVTHDLNAVSTIAQKVAMLREGRLLWSGRTEAAMDPELLGSLYAVPITVIEHDGRKAALF